MLRVGIDSGSGGIQGPLFPDGTFEYVPIPVDYINGGQTYGNTVGRHGRKLIEYFPAAMRGRMANQTIHFDPEFDTFTYGDPTAPKAGLRFLDRGDLLVFYCGLKGWNFESSPALYIMGYFDILTAGKATDFPSAVLKRTFGRNAHVMHRDVYECEKDALVLVKGQESSRLLNKAVCISITGQDRTGKPLKVLSPEMQRIFGDFDGRISFQRSPTRWVDPAQVPHAVDFVRSLQ